MLPAQGLIPLASVVSSRGTDAAVLLQPWTNPIASRKGVLGRGNYVPTPALRGESFRYAEDHHWVSLSRANGRSES